MPTLTRFPAPAEKAHAKGIEEIADHYQISMDHDGGVVFVEFSMRQNARGSYDAWIAVNLYGDTKRLYHNGEHILGNPPIRNQLVLEALSYLPPHIRRWIPELKDYKRDENK